MGFISWLKAAEQKVASVLKGAAKAEPMAEAIADTVAVAAGFPEAVPFINRIGKLLVGSGAVVTAVQGSEGNGAAKLAIAAPMVDQLFKNSGFLSDKVIADEAKWSAAIVGIASNFADLFNSLAPAQPPAK
jgi:hypothetical protein